MPVRASVLLLLFASACSAAELASLDAGNYASRAPVGKEVDAIYGDFVLQNRLLTAVVAAPGPERDANLTVRNVGGGVIDLTANDKPSDQLSAFYPGGGGYDFTERVDWPTDWKTAEGSAKIAFRGESNALGGAPTSIVVGYELRDGEPFVRVTTAVTNQGDGPTGVARADGFRLDGPFKYGAIEAIGLAWAHELDWRQAYGLQAEDATLSVRTPEQTNARVPRRVILAAAGESSDGPSLPPGETLTWRRRLIPAADSLAVQATAYAARGEALATGRLRVGDSAGPVEGTLVTVRQNGDVVGYALTDANGEMVRRLPPGDYVVSVEAQGHKPQRHEGRLEDTPAEIDADHAFSLSTPGYLEATVTDGDGAPIPAKVQLTGVGGTPTPHFGPESAVRGVRDLQYTPDGRFRCKLLPGRYKWVASHGPEHDAAYGEVTVAAGQTATIRAALVHSVDTTGWLSSELHSHSSPSGDNTASQAGRVLNLLAEHLEFCPCTEHQRIDVYDEHLATFDAQHRMLTCPGMELTGSPLPLNHQNAFPLVHKPREQDGGGPQTHADPVKQIERLAGWDNNSEKVVQTNHPDVAQMIGDQDQDGQPDAGFERMFGFMDVMEVHPPELIFEPLHPEEPGASGVGTGGWEGRGNAIVNWLQMLNLGYRVTGVVNTDAHYNWHGSGWMRNWVRSSTDNPAEASVHELVHEFEHGHVVMSNGPFMTVEARAAGGSAIPGDDLAASDGKVTLRVVVRCPSWIEVNRVQVFVNGRPVDEHNYTARTHGDWFADGPDVFDRELELRLDADAHLVVACCGEGRSIASMYGVEDWSRNLPVAVANPIFVDTNGDADGDGLVFEPNGDDLGLPLPTPEGLKPSHGHDHPNHRH